MTTPTRYEALQQVRAYFDTEQQMASAFGVSQPTVNRWLNQSKRLPAEYVLPAEDITGVSRHHLRPDLYPLDMPPGPAFIGVDRGTHTVAFNRSDVLQRSTAPAGRAA